MWFTWSADETRGHLHVNGLGLLKATSRSPSGCVCTSWISLHTTTPWNNSFSFALWICGGGHHVTVDAGYVPTTHYQSHENGYRSQAVGFGCRTWWHVLRLRYTTSWRSWLLDNHLSIPSEGLSLKTSYIQLYFLVCHRGYIWTVNFPSLVTAWLPFLIYRLLSWAGHIGLFPVHELKFRFFFVLFLFGYVLRSIWLNHSV